MIRGFFRETAGIRRPFITARVSIPSQNISDDVHFLVDTGADATLLAPVDVVRLRINVGQLPRAASSAGIGGVTRTASAAASLTLGTVAYDVRLRVLLPERRQQAALNRIPSLLGRDVLSRFALFMEDRSRRLMLLEPSEGASLPLP
jgi:hypothetical protein